MDRSGEKKVDESLEDDQEKIGVLDLLMESFGKRSIENVVEEQGGLTIILLVPLVILGGLRSELLLDGVHGEARVTINAKDHLGRIHHIWYVNNCVKIIGFKMSSNILLEFLEIACGSEGWLEAADSVIHNS